jgi:hypothetical protein
MQSDSGCNYQLSRRTHKVKIPKLKFDNLQLAFGLQVQRLGKNYSTMWYDGFCYVFAGGWHQNQFNTGGTPKKLMSMHSALCCGKCGHAAHIRSCSLLMMRR